MAVDCQITRERPQTLTPPSDSRRVANGPHDGKQNASQRAARQRANFRAKWLSALKNFPQAPICLQ